MFLAGKLLGHSLAEISANRCEPESQPMRAIRSKLNVKIVSKSVVDLLFRAGNVSTQAPFSWRSFYT